MDESLCRMMAVTAPPRLGLRNQRRRHQRQQERPRGAGAHARARVPQRGPGARRGLLDAQHRAPAAAQRHRERAALALNVKVILVSPTHPVNFVWGITNGITIQGGVRMTLTSMARQRWTAYNTSPWLGLGINPIVTLETQLVNMIGNLV